MNTSEAEHVAAGAVPESGAAARVLPLLAERENRELVVDWLVGNPDYEVVEPGETLRDTSFDCCIVDEGGLDRHESEIASLRGMGDPVAQPILLLLSPGASLPAAASHDAGPGTTGSGTTGSGLVDDVAWLPIRQEQLAWRLGTLVRLRRESVALAARERAFRETSEELESLIEADPNGIIVVDTDGTVERWNATAESLFGWEEAEVTGQALPVLPEHHLSSFDRLLPRVLDGEVIRDVETTKVTREGEERPVTMSLAPIVDAAGAVWKVLVIMQDRSDVVARKNEIERTQESLSLALDSANAGVWEWYLETDEVRWQESLERLFGLDPGEFDGTYETFREFVHPEDVDDLETRIERAIETAGSFRLTFRIRRADGTERWIDGRGRVLTDEDGTADRLVGVNLDITARQERIQQLGILDRVLRHNLHNDMTVVRGFAETIQRKVAGEEADYAERIVDASDRLLEKVDKQRLITRVLSERSSRIERDAVPLVETTVAAVRRDHPEANFAVSLPETAPVLLTEHFPLVLVELLENAVAHNPADEPTVRVHLVPVDDRWQLSVGDDGPGIPEMDREVLLGAEHHDPLFHGSGLGLWLVHLVIRRTGGTISVESAPATGSTVTLGLPGSGPAPGEPAKMDDG